MASPSNGGIIGVTNVTSFGKNTVTSTTCTGSTTITTQPGTRFLNYLVVAGGGGGGYDGGGGAGAGGYQEFLNQPVCGNTPYPIVVGGGGAAMTIGSVSSFNSVPSTGGGKGGGPASAAGVGGSGGGASMNGPFNCGAAGTALWLWWRRRWCFCCGCYRNRFTRSNFRW